MLEARPEKYRGARGYPIVGLNAGTASGFVLFPPASGLVVTRLSTSTTARVCILPADAIPTFTAGLAVTSQRVFPAWGPDYAPTAVLTAGQFAAVPTEAFGSAVTGFVALATEVFQPNVFAVAANVLAAAFDCGIEWREYLSAEELQRWPSSRA
jgi:hypothetical protein